MFRLTVTSPSPLIGVWGGRRLSPSIETPPGARRSIVVNGLAVGVLGTEDCAGAPASPLDCRLPKATFVVESDTLRLTLESLGVAFGSLGLSFVPRRKLLERDFISSGARLSPLVRSCYFRCRRAGKRLGAAAQGATGAQAASGPPVARLSQLDASPPRISSDRDAAHHPRAHRVHVHMDWPVRPARGWHAHATWACRGLLSPRVLSPLPLVGSIS